MAMGMLSQCAWCLLAGDRNVPRWGGEKWGASPRYWDVGHAHEWHLFGCVWAASIPTQSRIQGHFWVTLRKQQGSDPKCHHGGGPVPKATPGSRATLPPPPQCLSQHSFM